MTTLSAMTGEAITLRCRHILPMAGPPLAGGWIRIARGRIVALGRREPDAPVHDLGDSIIIPGLVNAHTHLEFSDCSTPLDATGGLPSWIERVVALRRSRGGGDKAEAARVRMVIGQGLAESTAAGVTAIGEIATAAPPSAYQQPGPRVRLFREGLGLSAPAIAHAAARIALDLPGHGLHSTLLGISPHAPYSVAAALGRRLLEAARACRLPVAMHIAESREEAELVATGTGPFRSVLESLGAWQPHAPPRLLAAAEWITRLAQAPRGIVVHGTHLPDDAAAMARLTRHRDRLCVAICPRTTRLISGRLPPVAAFREAGIRVAIGTDSRASNPDLSVLAECHTLVDAGLTSPKESLGMATRNGAWALMLEHRCGLLAPGRPADLAILSPATPHADPFTAALDPATKIIATMRAGCFAFRSPS